VRALPPVDFGGVEIRTQQTPCLTEIIGGLYSRRVMIEMLSIHQDEWPQNTLNSGKAYNTRLPGIFDREIVKSEISGEKSHSEIAVDAHALSKNPSSWSSSCTSEICQAGENLA
jgi:hypothetical protein